MLPSAFARLVEVTKATMFNEEEIATKYLKLIQNTFPCAKIVTVEVPEGDQRHSLD